MLLSDSGIPGFGDSEIRGFPPETRASSEWEIPTGHSRVSPLAMPGRHPRPPLVGSSTGRLPMWGILRQRFSSCLPAPALGPRPPAPGLRPAGPQPPAPSSQPPPGTLFVRYSQAIYRCGTFPSSASHAIGLGSGSFPPDARTWPFPEPNMLFPPA
jgi:hypothetical protein